MWKQLQVGGIVYLTDSNIFISLFTSNDYARSLFILSMFRMINDQPATRGEEDVVVCVQNIPNNLKVTACSTAQFFLRFSRYGGTFRVKK